MVSRRNIFKMRNKIISSYIDDDLEERTTDMRIVKHSDRLVFTGTGQKEQYIDTSAGSR